MYLAPLTSLRFFAAAFVFCSHLAFLHLSSSHTLALLYINVLAQGFIGVTFFFILSGFILSHSYGPGAQSRSWDWRGFMSGRIARIYPLHLLTLLFAVPMTVVSNEGASLLALLPEALANAALLQAFVPFSQSLLNSPAWSLSAEMFFYAMFPLLLTQRTRVLLGIFLVTALFQWAAIRLGPQDPLARYLVYVFPLSRIGDFVVGMLLYRLFLRFPTLPDRLATQLQAGAVALLVLFFVNKLGRFSYSTLDIYYVLPLAAIVLSFAWSNGALARGLSGRKMVFLGQTSFAFYMVHFPLLYYAQSLRTLLLPGATVVGDVVAAAVYFVACVGLGGLLFVYFEKPMQARVAHLLRRHWGRPPASSASPRAMPTSPAALQ